LLVTFLNYSSWISWNMPTASFSLFSKQPALTISSEVILACSLQTKHLSQLP
jgi:hypothetical protein